jgi:hypothetical protein
MYPHDFQQTGPRPTHTCQPGQPHNRQPRTTPDHLGRGTREAAQRGPAALHRPGCKAARQDTQVRAYKPDRPRDALPRHRVTPSSVKYSFAVRDGRTGLPAGSKTRRNRTYTAQRKATQCESKPNQKQNPTHGAQNRPRRNARTRSTQGRAARPGQSSPRAALKVFSHCMLSRQPHFFSLALCLPSTCGWFPQFCLIAPFCPFAPCMCNVYCQDCIL